MKKAFFIPLIFMLMLGLIACSKGDEIHTTVAYANWVDSDAAFESDENCLNLDKYVFSDFPRLPIFKFDTKSELDEFKNKYKDIFAMGQSYNEVASFNDVTENYDDEFFNNHSLMLTYIEANSGSFRYGITDVKKENGTLILRAAHLLMHNFGMIILKMILHLKVMVVMNL